jgi:hypothetical protein
MADDTGITLIGMRLDKAYNFDVVLSLIETELEKGA